MFIIDWVLDKFGYTRKATLELTKPCKKVATKTKTVVKKSQRRLG